MAGAGPGDGPVVPAAGVPDAELVRAAGVGDRDAFETLLHRHGPALLRYAVRTTGNRADAEDVVQEAFVAAWKGLDRYDGSSSPRTWLFTILHRRVVDLYRRRGREGVHDELSDDTVAALAGGADPFHEASNTELVRALDAALRRLPYRQRACWILVEVEGLTQPEVARALGMTPDAVRGQLFRARRALAASMAGWER